MFQSAEFLNVLIYLFLLCTVVKRVVKSLQTIYIIIIIMTTGIFRGHS